MKIGFMLILLFNLIFLSKSFSQNIAQCGASSGYAYTAYRGIIDRNNAKWEKDQIPDGKVSLMLNENGDVDIFYSNISGISSVLSDGGFITLATVSDNAVTVVVIFPNKLTETYVFQELKNGRYQVMWTQAKAETPVPRVTAFIADCSYLNLAMLKK